MLCANVALNAAWNIHAKHQALYRTHTTLGVPYVDYRQPGNFVVLSLIHDAPETVDAVTIDSLHLPQCRLIKADVQGMEADVLAGAWDTINRCHPFLYIENDSDNSELPAMIRELGYDVYEHKTPLFNPTNFRGQSNNLYPNIVSYNVLGVPYDLRSHVQVELKPWPFGQTGGI